MRAIVCGAGIAGLGSAWWLHHFGWDVTLVEIAPHLRDEGYMIDFFGSGYDVAEEMGLIDRLSNQEYPMDEVVYVNDDGSHRSHIDYETFKKIQGGRLLTVMRGDLERTLYEALDGSVDVRFGLTIDRLEEGTGSVQVVLSDGSEHRADLVVGADGIHSKTRRLVFGEEERFTRYLGYHTAAYIIESQALRTKLNDEFAIFAVPSKQAGLYPIRDGRVATFFAHNAPNPALPSDRQQELIDIYGDMGWHVAEALQYCPAGRDLYYDVVAQIEMPTWSKGAVTLVGDACQAMSLLSGQGACMALGGSYALANELASSNDLADGLRAYEQRVKPIIEQKQIAGRRTADWFVPSSRSRLWARDAVLRLATMPAMSGLMKPFLSSPGGSIVHPR